MGARYDRRPVQRLRFAVESTFGLDLTSDVASNFVDLRHMPTAIKRERPYEADNTVRQRFFQQRNRVAGPRRGSVAVEAYFSGHADPIDASNTTPTKTSQSKLMEALLGGYSEAAGGSAVVASPSPTTTSFSVTTGHGARFVVGQLISVVISSVAYPAMVTGISTDALTVWPALPSAPSTAAVVYGGQNIHCDETDERYLQWLHETQIDRGNIWLLKGCQGDLSFTLARGGLMTFSTTQQGAVYVHDDGITTPQGGGSLGVASYVDGPKWGTAGGFVLTPSSGSTRTMPRCDQISLSLGVTWIEDGDYAGTEGIGEWERGIPEMTAELTIKKNASDGTYELYQDYADAETDLGFLWWVGTASGAQVAICAPTCQLMADPEPVEVNGLEALKISLLLKENSLTSVTTAGSIGVSPVVIAQL